MALTKIEIITRSNKLDDLIVALNNIGVLGLTVSQVFGSGLQRGHKEVYRGKQYEIQLLPKIKVETVVSEVPVERVLEVARAALNTGQFGDGKIFVSHLDDAMRIRTGDRGDAAIRDVDGKKE